MGLSSLTCTGCWRSCRYKRFHVHPGRGSSERFSSAKRELWVDSENSKDWVYKTRGVVLGRMHQEKKEQWDYITSHCPLAGEPGPEPSDGPGPLLKVFKADKIWKLLKVQVDRQRKPEYDVTVVIDKPSMTTVRLSRRGPLFIAYYESGWRDRAPLMSGVVEGVQLRNEVARPIAKELRAAWRKRLAEGIET